MKRINGIILSFWLQMARSGYSQGALSGWESLLDFKEGGQRRGERRIGREKKVEEGCETGVGTSWDA